MLEILFLIFLSNKNKANAIQRGRKPGGFVALTICLWFGMEFLGGVIGGLLELGLGTYLLALIMAAIGGLISFLVAKNCKTGSYVTPAQSIVQNISENTEPLVNPGRITVVRESSMVGAAVNWRFFLNGREIGALGNGKTMSVSTLQKKNMLTARDAYGSELPPFVFEIADGGTAEIHFKVNRFLPERSLGLLNPGGAGNVQGSSQAAEALQPKALYCRKCGNNLAEGAKFCSVCGEPRFVP